MDMFPEGPTRAWIFTAGQPTEEVMARMIDLTAEGFLSWMILPVPVEDFVLPSDGEFASV